MELTQEQLDQIKRELRKEIEQPQRWEPIDPKEVLETVKIKHGNGSANINKDDFDRDKHELFDEQPKAAKK